MNTTKFNSHIKVALGYFVLAAILGLILRAFQFIAFPGEYKFMLHTPLAYRAFGMGVFGNFHHDI